MGMPTYLNLKPEVRCFLTPGQVCSADSAVTQLDVTDKLLKSKELKLQPHVWVKKIFLMLTAYSKPLRASFCKFKCMIKKTSNVF